MDKSYIKKVIAFPHPPAGGGPGSFQRRFEEKLREKGWTVVYAGNKIKPSLVMIVGGTRRIFWLLWMKFKGIPVIYRLDGIAWLHRRKKVSAYNYMLSEYRILTQKFIHAFIANYIIYQSKFVEQWWNKSGWRIPKKYRIIYNGVSLFKSELSTGSAECKKRLVILEGNIDYSPYAIQLINELGEKLFDEINIEVFGKFEHPQNQFKLNTQISYKGFLKPEEVYKVLTGSVYLSLDINPACPNTVIEALSCSAPVVAFDTGSLNELIDENSGIIVPYGSDPWKLAYPDVNSLIIAIKDIYDDYTRFSNGARARFEEHYTMDIVINNYMEIIDILIP